MLYEMIKLSMERLIAAETELNTLDKESGDGDCGSTLARGAKGQRRQSNNETKGLKVREKVNQLNKPQGQRCFTLFFL